MAALTHYVIAAMSYVPLDENDFEFINNTLLKYGNDDSVLDVSELDGFLAAVVSGPEIMLPEQWLPAIWGGSANEPKWEESSELERFLSLMFQHLNNIITLLMDYPKDYEAVFQISEHEGETVYIVEEWCFGYMRGIALCPQWGALPEELSPHLNAIALHGTEENFEVLDTMSVEEHQNSIFTIEPAVRKLHNYWLEQRVEEPLSEPEEEQDANATAKVDRDGPCPCGSGQKYKKCCLH